jgi:hypothetical protein
VVRGVSPGTSKTKTYRAESSTRRSPQPLMLEDVTIIIGLMASVEGTSTQDYLGQHTVTLHALSRPGGAEVVPALTAWTLDL